MSIENEKTKRGPKEKPSIKIPNKYFSYMEIYCAAQKITMPKLTEKIMETFFSMDDVKKVIEENDKLSKKKKLYEQKKRELAQLEDEIAELENS